MIALAHITKYSKYIFVRNLRIFKYIRTLTFHWSEYSNIFVIHSTTNPKPEMLSAVSTGKRIQRDERNVCGIDHAHMFRKDNF